MASLWMPGAEKRPGPVAKIGYPAFGNKGPKRGDVKHSAEGTAAGLLVVLNGARRASWHFSVLKDGTIWQHYPINAHCWHAGDVDDDGGVKANVELVGIEHEGVAGQRLTAAQVEATLKITRYCANYFDRLGSYARYPIMPADGWTLVEHNEVSDTYTACPSDRIPWTEIISELEDDMTTYKLFHTWGPAKLWLLQYVAGVPIYRRWIVTQTGAQMLIAEFGEPENTSLEQLATIPEL